MSTGSGGSNGQIKDLFLLLSLYGCILVDLLVSYRNWVNVNCYIYNQHPNRVCQRNLW